MLPATAFLKSESFAGGRGWSAEPQAPSCAAEQPTTRAPGCWRQASAAARCPGWWDGGPCHLKVPRCHLQRAHR